MVLLYLKDEDCSVDSANRRYYNTVDAAQVLTIGTDGTAVIMGGQETRLILMQRLTYQRFDFYF